ncbi:MAG: FAD-dependent oxidoreductase, partial [Candidatus Omnitrophota bacterium]
NVPGEREFKNKGVTYCATCDGPLFKDKSVAIIGGGNSALDAALQMIKISPKIYIINIAAQLTGDPIMIEKVIKSKRVEVLNNAKVKRIYGDTFVEGIEIERESQILDFKLKGVFIEIGWMPNSDFAKGVKKNNSSELIVDSENKTSIEGIFACGDVTDIREKQIIVACGEGAKASLGAFKYLSGH